MQGRVASLVDLSAGFHRDLTGRENLLIGGVLLGLTRNEVRERYDEIIAFSGLDRGNARLAARGVFGGDGPATRVLAHRAHRAGRAACRRGARRGRQWLPASVRRAGRVAPRRRNRGDARLARHDARAFPLRHRPPPRPRRARATWAIRPPPSHGISTRHSAKRTRRLRPSARCTRRRGGSRPHDGGEVSSDARTARVRHAAGAVRRARRASAPTPSEALRVRCHLARHRAAAAARAVHVRVRPRVRRAPPRLPGLPVRGVAAVDVPRAVDPRRTAEHLVRAGSRAARAVPLRVPAARAGRRHGDPVPRAPRRVRRCTRSPPTTCRSNRSRCW